MDRTDLNRLFTEKVTELIAQGYVINTGSMRGSQGEIAKVDLRKGDEIIRVMMLHNSRWSSGYDYNGIFEIIVSRNTDRILDNWDDTLWSHHMEAISQIELARVSNNHFVSLEEAREMVNKRNARWRAKRKPNRKVLGEAYKSIALRYVQRQPRMKSCKLSEIESVAHVYKEHFDQVLPQLAYYEIKARGKSFLLRPTKR
jgi:hypothetical protein